LVDVLDAFVKLPAPLWSAVKLSNLHLLTTSVSVRRSAIMLASSFSTSSTLFKFSLVLLTLLISGPVPGAVGTESQL
jgi:hypothetical protein